MRPDMARKLGRAIWRQRLVTYGPTFALLLFCASIGGYLFTQKLGRSDPMVETMQVDGTIMEAHRVSGRAAVFIAHVRLDDGREVDADSTLTTALVPKERVVVSQSRHASGKVSHHVMQLKN